MILILKLNFLNISILLSLLCSDLQFSLHVSILLQKPQGLLHASLEWQKPHFTALSLSFSIARPITYFHSTIKNLTLPHSAPVFQSTGPLHVFIVWQKTSLCCAQFQFFNPKSCYIYPMAYKHLNSFQPVIQKPHIKFIWESTFEVHVDHCWSDIGHIVHSHYSMHTVNFPWCTQNTFLLSTPIISCWAHQ